MKTITLETGRLRMRRMNGEDADMVFQNWASDGRVAKFMRWSVHESVEVTRAWLQEEERQADSDLAYNWGLEYKQTGELVGSAGLVWNGEKGLYELGYNVMYSYWNQGIATEASRKIVEFAFNTLQLRKLYCCHAVENVASQRVIEKLGFQFSGYSQYSSRDGTKTFLSKEYTLERSSKTALD